MKGTPCDASTQSNASAQSHCSSIAGHGSYSNNDEYGAKTGVGADDIRLNKAGVWIENRVEIRSMIVQEQGCGLQLAHFHERLNVHPKGPSSAGVRIGKCWEGLGRQIQGITITPTA